jgi:hypothetical protein
MSYIIWIISLYHSLTHKALHASADMAERIVRVVCIVLVNIDFLKKPLS